VILLDTCALLWIVAGKAARAGVAEELEAARFSDAVLLSPISVWEIAQKERKRPGSLGLSGPPMEVFRRLAVQPGVQVVELTPEVLVASVGLEGFGTADPVDRMIVATAIAHDARVLTADAKMLAYAGVRSIDYGRPG
jgi:PIN domain nuclease of toxin-antitoxin system